MKYFWIFHPLTLSLLIAACQPVATITPTAALTPFQQPSATLTVAPTATHPAPPAAKFVGSFGAGSFSGVFRSPDGKRIFVPMNGKELRWYDAKTLQQEGVMVLSDYFFDPSDVIFGPDPNIVAVVGFNTLVVDLKNRKVLASILGTETYLSGLQFSSDNKLLFFRLHETYNHGFSDQVRAWDIQQDHLAHSYWESEWEEQLHDYAPVTEPAISSDEKWIAAGYGNLLQIRDIQTEKLLQSFKGHKSEITSVTVNKDGSRLASVDVAGGVQLWDRGTGRALDSFSLKLATPVVKLSFSANDLQLIATSDDHSQQVIDLQTGRVQGPFMPAVDPLAVLLHRQGYSQMEYGGLALTISPDGRTVAVGSDVVLLWDIQSQKLLTVLENPGGSTLERLQFDPTGHLLAGTTYYQTLLWDLTSGAQPNLAKVFDSVVVNYASGALSFSSDGKYVATGRDRSVDIWDVETAQKVKTFTLSGDVDYLQDVHFLPDGQSLYMLVEMKYVENANGIASQIQLWDIEKGQMTRVIRLFGSRPRTSAFRWPFFAFWNKQAEIWNLETGKSKKLDDGLSPVFFSKNSDLLFGTSEYSSDDTFCIWQVESGKLVYTSAPLGNYSGYLQYSLDLLDVSNYVATYRYHEGIVNLFDISDIIEVARQP